MSVASQFSRLAMRMLQAASYFLLAAHYIAVNILLLLLLLYIQLLAVFNTLPCFYISNHNFIIELRRMLSLRLHPL